MSELLKQTLKKNAKNVNPDYEQEIEEELQDKVVELGDIDFPSKHNVNLEAFSPKDYRDHLRITEFISYGIPLYLTASHKTPKNIVFFCVHGAGLSGTSFCLLADAIKNFASLLTYDMRNHGLNKSEVEVPNLDINCVVAESLEVLQNFSQKNPDCTFVILGHSLGGSVASRLVNQIQTQETLKSLKRRVHGLIMIDVVEGTAI